MDDADLWQRFSTQDLTHAEWNHEAHVRTAYLHVNYRKIVPIEKELQVEAGVSRAEGRKIFVEMRLCDGSDVLADGEGLFVRLKPGQP